MDALHCFLITLVTFGKIFCQAFASPRHVLNSPTDRSGVSLPTQLLDAHRCRGRCGERCWQWWCRCRGRCRCWRWEPLPCACDAHDSRRGREGVPAACCARSVCGVDHAARRARAHSAHRRTRRRVRFRCLSWIEKNCASSPCEWEGCCFLCHVGQFTHFSPPWINTSCMNMKCDMPVLISSFFAQNAWRYDDVSFGGLMEQLFGRLARMSARRNGTDGVAQAQAPHVAHAHFEAGGEAGSRPVPDAAARGQTSHLHTRT